MFVYRTVVANPSAASDAPSGVPQEVFEKGMFPRNFKLGAARQKDWWKDAVKRPETGLSQCLDINTNVAVSASLKPEIPPLFPMDNPEVNVFMYMIWLPEDPIKIQLDNLVNFNLILPKGSYPDKEVTAIDVHSLQIQQAHLAYNLSINDPEKVSDPAYIGWALFAHEIALKEVWPKQIVCAIKCRRIPHPIGEEKNNFITGSGDIFGFRYGTDFEFVGPVIYNNSSNCYRDPSSEIRNIENLRDKGRMSTPSVFSGLGGTLLPNPLYDSYRKCGDYAVIMHLVSSAKKCINSSGNEKENAKAILDLFNIEELYDNELRKILCQTMLNQLEKMINAISVEFDGFKLNSFFYLIIDKHVKASENKQISKKHDMETLREFFQMMKKEANKSILKPSVPHETIFENSLFLPLKEIKPNVATHPKDQGEPSKKTKIYSDRPIVREFDLLELFKKIYEKKYLEQEFFSSLFIPKWHENNNTSLEEITDFAKNHPDSLTEEVLNKTYKQQRIFPPVSGKLSPMS